ncbi:MAG: DUF1553 domain-containing protein [Pirellulales bacterium]
MPQRISQRIRVAAPYLEIKSADDTKHMAELEIQIAAAEKAAAAETDAAFAGWAEGVSTTGGFGLPEDIKTQLVKREKERTPEESKKIATDLRKHFDAKVKAGLAAKLPLRGKVEGLRKQLTDYKGDHVAHVMIMSDDKPRETKILDRGDYLSPKEKVEFAVPAFLPPLPDGALRNRLGLAQWLFLPEHPLTVRVQVNRMWQHFFGAGIVKTSEDFGVQSEYPVHGPLLDWLAVEFRERGWSVKTMHRLIVTSATYRQSSRIDKRGLAEDPENRLYGRAVRFRMPAMLLRDWALASSGMLVEKVGGAPVYPYQPDGIWEALAITKERDFTYPASKGDDLYRRSLYTFWRRTVGPANMFDAANRQACRVRQATTSTPLHALTTLNDPTWIEAARTLAQRVTTTDSTVDERLERAFRKIVLRAPSLDDPTFLRKAYDKQLAIYRGDAGRAKALISVGASKRDESLDPVEHAALTAVCLMIMNLDESLTRE